MRWPCMEVQASGRRPDTDAETFQKLSAIFEIWDRSELLAMVKNERMDSPSSGEFKHRILCSETHLQLEIYTLNNATIEIQNSHLSFYLLAGFATVSHHAQTTRHGGNTHATPGKIQEEALTLSGTGTLITLRMSV